jgi:signal transduction histidine kinase/ligand-binding sensor domain-containing protein
MEKVMTPFRARARKSARFLDYSQAAGLCWVLACFCAAPSAFAQYHFDSYTADNGLPHNAIAGMCQTRDGYLWVATGNGLLRFDGVHFQIFNSINTPALEVNGFSPASLLEDRQGDLWAGTWAGGVVRYHDGVFTEYTSKDGLVGDQVVRIDEDSEGTVWIFTNRCLAQWKNGHLVRVAPQSGSPFNRFLAAPRNLWEDAAFAGLWRWVSGGWQRFAYGRWSPVPLPPGIRSPAKVKFRWIIEDSERRLWYSLLERRGEYYCVRDGQLTTYSGLPPNVIVSYKDRQGFLWITDPGRHGVALWKDGQSTSLDGLSTTSRFRVLVDHEGGIWVGTEDEGLYCLRRQAITVYGSKEHRGTEDIHVLLRDRSGKLWFGSNTGLGLFRDGRLESSYDPGPGSAPVDTCISCEGEHSVLALYEDRDGTLWVGTGNGVARLRGGRLRREKSLLARIRNAVNVIYRDREGNLWFGGDGGLYRLHAGELRQYSKADGLGADSVNTILEDRAGTLWIGTEKGLARFSNGAISSWTDANGWASAEVNSLYEDDQGVLWAGSFDKGLSRIEKGKVTRITTAQGLYSNSIFSVIDDDQGFLWMASSVGLFRARKQELNDFAAGRVSYITSTHFGKADGLFELDCTNYGEPGWFKTRDGKVWFRTRDGIGMIDPKLVPLSKRPPPVTIESCILDHNPAPCSGGLTIHPSRQDLEIDYAGLSFIRPDDMRFKYRLVGLDRDWVEAGTRRTAYYSHLPPGHYRFQVIAANSDGVWNLEGKSMPVIVLPPFYRTWWFLLLASLIAAGTVVLAWQYRVAQLKRVNTLQQVFSRELINSQEQERKRIAAELHDSLGQTLAIIKNRAVLSLSGPDDHTRALEQLDEIAEAASHAIEEVREIVYNLRPYHLERLGLTKSIEAMIRRASTGDGVRFAAEIEPLDSLFSAEAEINVYRILQEAISNIVKHAQATEAKVSVKRSSTGADVVIQDNGRGFLPCSADPTETRRGGFGLIGIAERARLLGGDLTVDSAPGGGTVLTIRLRNDKSHHGA